MKNNRIERKEAQTMEEVMGEFVRAMKLKSGLNRQRIFEAWDKASGAERYTIGKNFKNGILYCSIASSVVRNQLSFRITELTEEVNAILDNDELFIKNENNDKTYVRTIILK